MIQLRGKGSPGPELLPRSQSLVANLAARLFLFLQLPPQSYPAVNPEPSVAVLLMPQ